MDTIFIIEGADLGWAAAVLAEAKSSGSTVRVTLHTGEHGGLQLKVDGGCWTPPIGQLDPTCTTGRIRAAAAHPSTCTVPGCRWHPAPAPAERTVAVDTIDDGPHVNFEA
jgi:hypothetical protein